MRPGNITKQYNVCGSPGCACKDEKNPKKHGPYLKLNYQHQGKSKTMFIKEKDVKKIALENKNYINHIRRPTLGIHEVTFL